MLLVDCHTLKKILSASQNITSRHVFLPLTDWLNEGSRADPDPQPRVHSVHCVHSAVIQILQVELL